MPVTWVTIWWYLLLAFATLGAVPAVHALRRRTSLVYSYAVVAFMAFAGWAVPHSASIATGGLRFGVPSTVLFGSVLGGVFLLYVADGSRAGRMGVVVVVAVGALYTALATLLNALCRTVGSWTCPLLPLDGLRAGAASIAASVGAFVLLGVAWESMQRHSARAPLFLRVFLTLLVVLLGDTCIYFPLAWSHDQNFTEAFAGTLLSRAALALLYAPLVTLYLQFEVRRHGLTFTARPILSIVAKEDLERELLSARHSLRLGAEALWVSEEQYRRMVDDIPLLVFRFSSDGIVTYANRALSSHYRRAVDAVVGKWVLLPVDKSERDHAWKRVLALTPSHPTAELTVHTYPVPGDRRVERWVVRGVFSPKGEGVAYQAIGEDVTAQFEQEKKVRRLRAAIDQANECVAITDRNGWLEFVNPALERHSGRSIAELLGQRVGAIVASQPSQEPYQRLAEDIRRRGAWTGRIGFEAGPGETRHYQLTVTPLKDEPPGAAGYVGIATDVSHEVELEAAREQVRRMDVVAQLAGGVAHDFKNLAALVWMSAGEALEALTAHAQGALSTVRDALKDIRQAADRALLLTRQLVTIGRQDEVRPQPVSLSQAIADLAPLLRRLLPDGVRLEIESGPAPVALMTLIDPSQLERVVVNLVVNARDAMPKGGLVKLCSSSVWLDEEALRPYPGGRAGRHVVLTVSDTGQGIDAGVRQRIFEPFFTTRSASGGTGLGLSTVYGIVQQAGGHVRVESSPGAGATFRVCLPAIEDPATTSTSPARRRPLLYCESDDATRGEVTRVLEAAGYRVVGASDAQSLLDLLSQAESEPPSLLLANAASVTDGEALAAAVRERHPGVPTVFLSSSRSAQREGPVRRGERDWYVFGPSEPEDLLSAIDAAIAHSWAVPAWRSPAET